MDSIPPLSIAPLSARRRLGPSRLYGRTSIPSPPTTKIQVSDLTMGWDGNARGTVGSDYTKNILSTGTEAAFNMYLQYRYTNDSTYLRNTAYPFMRDVVRFYAAKLTKDLAAKLKAHTAQQRFSAGLLCALPLVFGVGSYFLKPDYVSLLWTDPVGSKFLTYAIISEIVGILIIRKIANIRV